MADPTEINRRRRSRRRASSACFLFAGIAFGTALYLLRARFYLLFAPGKRLAFFALILVMAVLFWMGSRAEAEVARIDDELRRQREDEAQRRRR